MKITSRTVVALGSLAATALAAPASMAQDTGWYAGAGVGRSAATIDDERISSGLAGQGLSSNISDRDRDTGYRLFGGYQLNRNFAVEAGLFDMGEMGYTATTTPAGTLVGDVRFRGIDLDLVGTLPLGERFSLLARVGAAHVRTRGTFSATGAVTLPYSGTSTSARRFGLKYGAGLAWRLAEAWELRLEGERMRVDDSVGNRGHVDFFGLSVVYRFGAPATPARAAAPTSSYVSPVTPAPAVAPDTVVAAPAAPPPPPPPPPAPRAMTVHFSADALFDFDRAILRPQGGRDLDAIVAQLRDVQFDLIQVVGHTDRLGSAAYNADLSRRRAAAVAAYLVNAGIAADKIRSSGVGEDQPLPATANCRGTVPTPELIVCLQPDRRVEVEVRGLRSP